MHYDDVIEDCPSAVARTTAASSSFDRLREAIYLTDDLIYDVGWTVEKSCRWVGRKLRLRPDRIKLARANRRALGCIPDFSRKGRRSDLAKAREKVEDWLRDKHPDLAAKWLDETEPIVTIQEAHEQWMIENGLAQ